MNGKVILTEGSFDDWWTITDERGCRINSADIEGDTEEMLQIATSIERGELASFKRCRVHPIMDHFELDSPRNSISATTITRAQALGLAADIRAKVLSRNVVLP